MVGILSRVANNQRPVTYFHTALFSILNCVFIGLSRAKYLSTARRVIVPTLTTIEIPLMLFMDKNLHKNWPPSSCTWVKELSITKGTLQNAIHRPATARFANRKFVVVCICWNFFTTNSTTKFPRKAPDINML